MGIFNKNKLKIKESTLEKGVNYFIDYSSVKDEKKLKFHILKNIAKSNKILIVIDTRLLFENIHKNYQKQIFELIDTFNKHYVKYTSVKFESENDVAIFGFRLNSDFKKTKTDYLIGFVVDAEISDEIKTIINDFTLRFYFNINEQDEEKLLNMFISNQDSYEALQDFFDISILNDSLSKKLIIFSKHKASNYIKEAIETSSISN